MTTNLPVPVPRTFGVQEYETAAYLNAVRDALNFLLNRPIGVFTQTSAQASWAGYAPISLDTTVVDSYGAHSNTTNPSRYVAQVAGWYSDDGVIGYASNTTGARDALISKNGTALPASTVTMNPTGTSTFTGQAVPRQMTFCNVGDYLEIQGNSGNNAATVGGDSGMTVIWEHA